MDKLGSKSTRVLLTGSNGFLGQKLTDFIIQKTDYSLCCTSNSANRNPLQEGYEFVQLDLLDTDRLLELIANYKPTHIVHTAAMTSVEACEQDVETCKKLNVEVVATLAQQCQKDDIHFTFLSTDFVFDGVAGPYDETADCNPCNAYGQSKLDAEVAILESGCRAAILRTILVYGIIADRNRSNLVLWAKSKLENQEAIKVVSDQWRMPTWVDDLAEACLLCIERNAEGIFHISSDKMYSILEAVEAVADFWGFDKSLISPIKAEEIGQSKNRPQKTGFILSKAIQELGYKPTSFLDSLKFIEQQYSYYRS